ncbi:MAG: DinB family protein, partial [Ignavibacteria bacterium]
MDNINRIKKLLNDHFDGTPWIDHNIIDTLRSVSAKKAAVKEGELNSIWQIVNHMIAWREALIGRVKDKPIPTPDNNFISDVKDISPKAWKDTLKRFECSQKDIIAFLDKSKDLLLEKISPT